MAAKPTTIAEESAYQTACPGRRSTDMSGINLKPKEAAARLRVSISTLANWRTTGEGPKFLKIGRKVLYPVAELEAFEQASTRTETVKVAK